MKRIVFATFGSLGDLHPYVAISQELVRRGHRPLIATFEEYRGAVKAAGIGFAPMRPSMSVFGDKTAVMERLFDPWRGPEIMVREMFMPRLRDSYRDLADACHGADLLVTHPLSFAGPLLAQKEGLRWVSTILAPLSLFSDIDPPLLPGASVLAWARKLGVAPYRWMFRIPRAVVRRWEQPLREFRAELGLPATDAIAQFEGQFSRPLNLALFSPALAAPQPDWPANTRVCGFPRYDGAPLDPRTHAELEAFLASGEPPIVFGLGSSAVMIAGDFWHRAIAATRQIGRRAILLTGKPPEDLGSLPRDVKAFQYLPYSEVFPRAAAIVHPGGIGTLAQALSAGRPQLIVPVAFDQPDNARRAFALGVARSLPFRKATAATMARELSALLASPDCASRAAAVGVTVAREDGARVAANALEGICQSDV